jgi:hypothetical protein
VRRIPLTCVGLDRSWNLLPLVRNTAYWQRRFEWGEQFSETHPAAIYTARDVDDEAQTECGERRLHLFHSGRMTQVGTRLTSGRCQRSRLASSARPTPARDGNPIHLHPADLWTTPRSRHRLSANSPRSQSPLNSLFLSIPARDCRSTSTILAYGNHRGSGTANEAQDVFAPRNVMHRMQKTREIPAILGFCCCGVPSRRRRLWRPSDIPPGAAALGPHIYAARRQHHSRGPS